MAEVNLCSYLLSNTRRVNACTKVAVNSEVQSDLCTLQLTASSVAGNKATKMVSMETSVGNNSSKENTTHFCLRELGTTYLFTQLMGHVRMALQSSSVTPDAYRNPMVC